MQSDTWDKVFEKNIWGRYPSEELIRFIAGNFYASADRKGMRILEVGCGTGANLWYMAREGFDVTGIDSSKVGIGIAAKRLKEESLEADLKVADMIKLPFEDNAFDCVVDIEAIYANSYEDSKRIMAEIYRVLKPKGKFFSKTLMRGTTDKSAYNEDYGTVRDTSEHEIYDLYGAFDIEAIDYTVRTVKNKRHEIKEWIIACSKQ